MRVKKPSPCFPFTHSIILSHPVQSHHSSICMLARKKEKCTVFVSAERTERVKEVKGSGERFYPHPKSTAHVSLLSIKQHCHSPETEKCITSHTTHIKRAFDRHTAKYEVRKNLIMKLSLVSAVPNECFLVKWDQYKQVVCGFDFTQKKDAAISFHVWGIIHIYVTFI